MKKLPIKMALLFTVLFASFQLFAQDFQGKAYYMSKTTMDFDQFGGQDMSAERKKQMQERMRSFLEKEFTLTFTKSESIYKEEEKLEAPGSRGGRRGFGGSLTGGPLYKNVQTKELLQDQEFFGKQFLVQDELKPIEWKMGTETKEIGQYTCFKATAIIEPTGLDLQSFRRPRRGGANNEAEKSDASEGRKTIEVVAWYSPQIPVNQGPDNYWGLPGLILEINADRTTILCTKIVLNPEDKETIEKPKKGQKVTQEEYTEITTKKMEEMREMYGGRNRGGGRGRG